jgi:hypothetical protein
VVSANLGMRLPSQKGRSGLNLKSRRKGEEVGRRSDDYSPTMFAIHWRELLPCLTPLQAKRIKAYVECDGNQHEAAFRAGTEQGAIRSAVMAGARKLAKLAATDV